MSRTERGLNSRTFKRRKLVWIKRLRRNGQRVGGKEEDGVEYSEEGR